MSSAAGSDPTLQRVLITGASSGIGMATAIAFGERRARVALVARGRDGLESGAAAVRKAGAGEALVLPCDVTDRSALHEAMSRTAAGFGGIDIAVINAGAAAYGRFTATDPDAFDRTIAISLTGAVNTIRAVLPALEESGGKLIVVGSAAARVPLPLLSAYTAAKLGLRGFVDALQIELRAQGSSVSVAVVSPGPVNTPFWTNVAPQEGRMPPLLPGAWSYHPSEVAAAVVNSANRPGNRGSTVGGMMTVLSAGHSLLNPISELVLARLVRWAVDAGESSDQPGAINAPTGDGEARGPLRGRASIQVRVTSAAVGLRRRLAARERRRSRASLPPRDPQPAAADSVSEPSEARASSKSSKTVITS